MRPEALAVRVVNEYRGRDLVGYLSLRHLFRASSARADRWAREIAPELCLTRTSFPYRANRVYKGLRLEGREKALEYRELHIPGPAEMLAEAALLDACSRVGGAFARDPNVFSNVLAVGDARHGIVDPYFLWWRRRQTGILAAAKAALEGTVVYFDVMKFYDSVGPGLVSRAWAESCKASGLERKWRLLGEKLIADYNAVGGRDHGLLVGPVFAHMMANLVLARMDRVLAAKFPGRYFRYVDDIAIVLRPGEPGLRSVSAEVSNALPPGLKLHEAKTLQLGCAEWARDTEAFSVDSGTESWARFAGALKFFMLSRSELMGGLRMALRLGGFRVPLLDYSRAVFDLSYIERLVNRFKRRREDQSFPRTVEGVMALAQAARRTIQSAFDRVVSEEPKRGMSRKFQLRRMRYVAGRLLFVGAPNRMPANEAAIEGVTELSDLVAIYKALRMADVTELLSFSSSVAQSAAQVLSAEASRLRCNVREWRPELESAWAVLKAYGVEFTADAQHPSETPLVAFARQEVPDSIGDPYYREIFSLARGGFAARENPVGRAFDSQEEPVFDAIQLLRASS